MYEYETCCVNSTAELIDALTEDARQITWPTFRKHVSWEQVRELFPFYSYRGETYNPDSGELTSGFHIKDDWPVSFWKSSYDGRPCYYLDHSRIEYIFTEVQ
jgi:hypothetical protein